MTFRASLAALAVLAATAGPAAADLVTNGDFETGHFPLDWTAGVGVVIDSSFVSFGNYDAEFQDVGLLSQPLTTVPGQSYVLSFYALDENSASAPWSDTFNVWWGAVPLEPITGSQAPSWTQFQFTIPGSGTTGTTTTLSFQGLSAENWNLDDVSVTPASNIPEPATWALLLVAFAALGARLGVRSSRRPAIARS